MPTLKKNQESKQNLENIEELRKLIKIELADCNVELWPFVCKMQSTAEGYRRIESTIIRLVAKEAMPIGSAIALIEQEMAHERE